MINLRTYIITILIAVLAIGLLFWYYSSKENDAIDMSKYILKTEMEKQIKQRDSITVIRDETINQLIKDNENAKENSQYWYEQAKKKSVNPHYDIDFITASRIITESNYKPD